MLSTRPKISLPNYRPGKVKAKFKVDLSAFKTAKKEETEGVENQKLPARVKTSIKSSKEDASQRSIEKKIPKNTLLQCDQHKENHFVEEIEITPTIFTNTAIEVETLNYLERSEETDEPEESTQRTEDTQQVTKPKAKVLDNKIRRRRKRGPPLNYPRKRKTTK